MPATQKMQLIVVYLGILGYTIQFIFVKKQVKVLDGLKLKIVMMKISHAMTTLVTRGVFNNPFFTTRPIDCYNIPVCVFNFMTGDYLKAKSYFLI